MFGMGGSEIIVILIVALLFLGPDKLPEAAKQISKGIRDIKKQSRILTQSIEDDEHIGGALRDIKSALRGEDEPAPPLKPRKPIKRELPAGDPPPENSILPPAAPAAPTDEADEAELAPPVAAVTLPISAGEPDPDVKTEDPIAADAELAAMIRPAAGTVAKGAAAEVEKPKPEPEHG